MPAITICGFCRNRIIAKDEPALFTRLPGVKRERVRCCDCAGEPMPDLPERLEPRDIASMAQTGFTKRPDDFTHVGALVPKTRTRGSLRDKAREWMPYSEDL